MIEASQDGDHDELHAWIMVTGHPSAFFYVFGVVQGRIKNVKCNDQAYENA